MKVPFTNRKRLYHGYSISVLVTVSLSLSLSLTHTQTHTHTHVYTIYLSIFRILRSEEKDKQVADPS